MFARVNSVQTAPDKLAGLLKFAGERLPDAREAPGFRGFYLLTDRRSGKLVSISLWASHDDMQQFETQGTQAPSGSELGASASPLLRLTSMR